MVPKSTIHKQRKKISPSFCIVISFPISSNISQNDVEMFEEQQQEI